MKAESKPESRVEASTADSVQDRTGTAGCGSGTRRRPRNPSGEQERDGAGHGGEAQGGGPAVGDTGRGSSCCHHGEGAGGGDEYGTGRERDGGVLSGKRQGRRGRLREEEAAGGGIFPPGPLAHLEGGEQVRAQLSKSEEKQFPIEITNKRNPSGVIRRLENDNEKI